jgi:hypothetical protein
MNHACLDFEGALSTVRNLLRHHYPENTQLTVGVKPHVERMREMGVEIMAKCTSAIRAG